MVWNQTVESVISTLEQNPWETSSFLAETFIIVSNFPVHSHVHKSLPYILLLNPLQCYPPRHSSLLHLCFLNSPIYQEASSIEVLLLNIVCILCLPHVCYMSYPLHPRFYQPNSRKVYDVLYYAVFFNLVWIPDILLTTLNSNSSIHVPLEERRFNFLPIQNDKKYEK